MKLSEAIDRLQRIMQERGDLVVGVQNTEFVTYEPLLAIEVRKRQVNQDEQYGGMFDDDAQLGDEFVALS